MKGSPLLAMELGVLIYRGDHTWGQLSFKEAMAGTLFTAAHPNMGLRS